MAVSSHRSNGPTVAQDAIPLVWRRLGREPSAALSRVLGRYMRTRRATETLKLEGDSVPSVFFLVEGWLAVSKSLQDGHRQIIDLLLPGDVLDPGSADANASVVQIEALADTRFAAIPVDVWARLLDDEPDIRHVLDTALRAAVARMSERMLRLGKGSAESRVAYALIELCLRLDAVGATGPGGFHVPLTQQQLGDFTGLSAVHICRTLRRMARREIVAVEDHMDILIRDMHALAEIAGIDPEGLGNQIIPGGTDPGAGRLS